MSGKPASPGGGDNGARTLTVALLTVCVAPDLAEQLALTTARMPWALEHLEFDQYISAQLRPRITPAAKNAQAALAIVDFDRDPQQALGATAYLRRLFFGRITVVGLGRSTGADFLLSAMRAGCNEFLDQPLAPAKFQETLDRLAEQWAGAAAQNDKSARILSFFGAKGGVGTTTVALQLAVALVAIHRKKVLLIDNHRDLGHICLYLGMDGTQYHFDELMRNVSRLDSELLRGFIATHASGLDVLSSPDLHDETRSVDSEGLRQTLHFLRAHYDYILMDCEKSLSASNLAAMDCSDRIYLVATPLIGAIRDLSRYVDGLAKNPGAQEKLHVVVNRFASQEAVGIGHIEKAIRLPVEIKICNNYFECARAANIGEPIPPAGKSEFSRQFARWAESLAGAGEEKPDHPAKRRFAWRR
jgi:pilus assembly protein CpaE